MYVILTYDVSQRRSSRIMKTCRKYLNHVQKSVFEGEISEKALNKLKKELSSLINVKSDACSIYIIHNTKFVTKQMIGMTSKADDCFINPSKQIPVNQS